MRSFDKKSFVIFFLLFCCLAAAYVSSVFYSESLAHIYPRADMEDISFLYGKNADELSDEEYALIFNQTGLGKAAAESLPSLSLLSVYQKAYFEKAEYKCIKNSPISFEERVDDPAVKLAGLQNGDILVTRAAHILSWRNGHAAIVTDAEKGVTLEAVVIGEYSCFQDISKWKSYPNFLVLRLKGAPKELREKIAEAARTKLYNKPYNAAVGIFPRKYRDMENTAGTQCAHLVWTAYASFGYDIDSDGGLIVTPKDIAESSLLEVVQSYGF